jgi:hypothetical protein
MAAVANQVHSTAQQIGARIGWKESVGNNEGIQKRGLEEIDGDFLEADFGTMSSESAAGVTSR